MDVYLNATRKLDGYVANGITRGASPKHIYDIDLAVNYSAQAAEDAAKAAKLASLALTESRFIVAGNVRLCTDPTRTRRLIRRSRCPGADALVELCTR